MAVKIRLRRTGSKNAACFRVVAADTRSPRDGKFIELLGWYDPRMKKDNFSLKMDRIEYWIGEGAIPSDTVKSLVKKSRKVAKNPAVAEKVEEVIATVAPEEVAAPTVEEEAVVEEAEEKVEA
ncbi:MAG: 30S ribosomal protein S16 [Kiritimatiellae bacterium]|nr:30S ribosomal protein S16 [Kiritimatiellia bacterium]